MAQRPYEGMSRPELIAEVRRLRALVDRDTVAQRLLEIEINREELQVYADELEEARNELAQSRDRYAELFDFAPIGYAVLDGQGVVTRINLAAARLLGAERSRLLGYPFHSFAADRRLFIDTFGRCRRTHHALAVELDLRSRTGALVPAHVTLKQLAPAESEESPAFVMAIVDLTERRRAEEERRAADEERRRIEVQEQLARAASDAKDRFIAVLSHEIRTPLTPILFALASLRTSEKVPRELAPTLDMIRRNVELEARLIEDLLDVSRIAQGKLRLALDTIDLHAAVEEVVHLCADEIRLADVRVSLELRAAAHHVRADGTRLRQVIWNLLKNAVRNSPPRGTVMIGSANRSPHEVTLSVEDAGAGIPPDLLARLFRPFEQGADATSRSPGLGLGLAIAKGILDAHGGRIGAASDAPGRGATFTVELPTVTPPEAMPSDRRRPPRAAARPKKVLLVEDNQDNAAAIAELLRASGYDVDVAPTIEVAVCKADGGFDVLVSDIGLPDGSGRDLLDRLRREAAARPAPAIALTGYGTDADVRMNVAAGFARHLTKPVDPDDLVAAIEELTGDSRERALPAGRGGR